VLYCEERESDTQWILPSKRSLVTGDDHPTKRVGAYDATFGLIDRSAVKSRLTLVTFNHLEGRAGMSAKKNSGMILEGRYVSPERKRRLSQETCHTCESWFRQTWLSRGLRQIGQVNLL
jgi:hypothetical protein